MGWVVRHQLALGTLKLARMAGLKLARRFSIAYAADPEMGGSVGAFRSVLLAHAMELAPRVTGSQKQPNPPETWMVFLRWVIWV